MPARTKAAGSSSGNWRGANRAPVLRGSASRSSRKLRQSPPREVVSDHVPATPQGDEPEGLDEPLGALPGGRRVTELQSLAVAACLRDGGEGVRIDADVTVPGRGHRHDAEGLRAAPQPHRQHLDDLGQRPHRRLRHPGDRRLRGRLQAHHERHRLVVVQDEGRQGGTGREPVAAIDPRLRLHRIAQVAQPFDVPAQRPHRHSQPGGEVGAGPHPPALHQRQEAKRAVSGVGHRPDSHLSVPGSGTNSSYRRP